MTQYIHSEPAGADASRRVFYFNAGFLRQRRIRRILDLAGLPLQLGKPGAEDLIAVWGRSPYAARGEAMAQKTGAGIVRVEDAFLRSLRPGRAGEPPLGLLIDHTGVHFDSSAPSDLETLLATHPLDDTALMDRARGCIARMAEANLTKYTAFDPGAPCPDPGYVLVLDQTRGDASVTHGGADANTFREMLFYAQQENPGCPVLIKTHPETVQGHRQGYFGPDDTSDRVSLFSDLVSPWKLMEGAVAVYAVTSQLGFEAIFAGHKPHVFGQPFYSGWDLTEDRHPNPISRRGRTLSRAQLFAAAMILYPKWYDPHRDRLCELEDAISILEARTNAWRADHRGWVASGMRLWKRRPLQKVFGAEKRVIFKDDPAHAARVADATGRAHMCWAGKTPADMAAIRVEDGFLRSRGLGADLVPPLSLVCDDLGIYYDPTRESRLERWIIPRENLRPDQDLRAERLIRRLVSLGLSKYNLGLSVPDLPDGPRVLVPGQVEDDASLVHGASEVRTNRDLLVKTRDMNPEACLIYKPHPDVVAGLRKGAVEDAETLADVVLDDVNPDAAMKAVEAVYTISSTLGFEALLRGLPVTCTGAPFYAGWGLTTDHMAIPRRTARPTLDHLAHAALIGYPRYFNPNTGDPMPIEAALDWLAEGRSTEPDGTARLLAKLQGLGATLGILGR